MAGKQTPGKLLTRLPAAATFICQLRAHTVSVSSQPTDLVKRLWEKADRQPKETVARVGFLFQHLHRRPIPASLDSLAPAAHASDETVRRRSLADWLKAKPGIQPDSGWRPQDEAIPVVESLMPWACHRTISSFVRTISRRPDEGTLHERAECFWMLDTRRRTRDGPRRRCERVRHRPGLLFNVRCRALTR